MQSRKQFAPNSDSPFHGIVNCWTFQGRDSLHDQKIANVTASSNANKDLLTENTNDFENRETCFTSDNKEHQWRCCDVKGMRVRPIYHQILSRDCNCVARHLRKVIVEILFDGYSWM
jgi:hypothetical protein